MKDSLLLLTLPQCSSHSHHIKDILVLGHQAEQLKRLREWTSFKMVIFHKQRAITAESMVRYGSLSNLKKTSPYLTM